MERRDGRGAAVRRKRGGHACSKHETAHGEEKRRDDGAGDEQACVTLAAVELAQQRLHMDLPGQEAGLGIERDAVLQQLRIVEVGAVIFIPCLVREVAEAVIWFDRCDAVIAVIQEPHRRIAQDLLRARETVEAGNRVLLDRQVIEARCERRWIGDMHARFHCACDRLRQGLGAIPILQWLDGLNGAL